MGSLNNFLGKPKEIDIDGTKITICPLKVKDMQVFSKQAMTEDERVAMSRELLKLSIKDSTEEEINNLPVEVFIKLMEEVNKLNGFTEDRTIRTGSK